MSAAAPDQATLRRVASWLTQWRRPLLVSHHKPDGDALGSLLALRRLLTHDGTNPTAVIFEPLPPRLRSLERFGPLSVIQPSTDIKHAFAPDAIVLVDTAAYAQLEPIADWLKSSPLPKLVIDHHVTRDVSVDEGLFDESAAATCLMLFDLAQAATWPIDPETAGALFVGLATDTGWFRHSNTDARALSAASTLTALGVNPNRMFQELYQQDSPPRLRLLGAALETLELLEEGELAVMQLDRPAFERCAASPADTEDVVNEPLRIQSVRISVLLVEHGDGPVRINFRSKPPADLNRPSEAVDVAAVAQALGGGGHPRAAGARIPGRLDEVRGKILKCLIAALKR